LKRRKKLLLPAIQPIKVNLDLMKQFMDETRTIYFDKKSYFTRVIILKFIRNRLNPQDESHCDTSITRMIHDQLCYHMTRPLRTRINHLDLSIHVEPSPNGVFFISQSNHIASDFFRALRHLVSVTLQAVRNDCRIHTQEDVSLWDIEYHLLTYENHFMELGPAFATRNELLHSSLATAATAHGAAAVVAPISLSPTKK
jgi:hypothetical protein